MRCDIEGMDKAQLNAPSLRVEYSNGSTVIPKRTTASIVADLTNSKTRMKGRVSGETESRRVERSDQLTIRTIHKQSMTMRRRFPRQKPLAVGCPDKACCVECLREP